MWDIDFLHTYTTVLFGFIILVAIYHFTQRFFADAHYMQTTYNPNGHTWRSIQCNKSIPYDNLCSVCGKLMLPTVGLFCECCGLSACKRCLRRIKKNDCKPFTLPADSTVTHHWVKIGIPREEYLDHTDEFQQEYFCCWCQRVRTFPDGPDPNEVCDYGDLRDMIIPPTRVCFTKGKITVKPLPDSKWEPIIVLANRKSGSNIGDEILSLFRGLLNPMQVVDLSSSSPESVVRWLPPRCRVLVAGGDGTVAWVLNALAQANLKIAVGILPLGTGNDLSRVLGWGAASSADIDARAVLHSVAAARVQQLDRWKLTVRARGARLGRRERSMFVYNYFSVGVDAQVALDFHRARSQFLYRIANRTVNHIAYVCFGATRALDDAGCCGLEQRLSVRVDGASESLALPPVQALVLLNIPSWGAGVDLWRTGGCPDDVGEQKVDDEKLEVVGISSSFHIATLQCGLAQPYRFAQASKVELELTGGCAMQADGEPWYQRAASVRLEHAGQCAVLCRHTVTNTA